MQRRKESNGGEKQNNGHQMARAKGLLLYIGLIAGALLALLGFTVATLPGRYVEEWRVKRISSLDTELEDATSVQIKKQVALEMKGAYYNQFTKSTDGDAYTLMILATVRNAGSDHCGQSEYKYHPDTSQYCAIKNKLDFLRSLDRNDVMVWKGIVGIVLLALGVLAVAVCAKKCAPSETGEKA